MDSAFGYTATVDKGMSLEIFARLEKLMPELLSAMRQDLNEKPLRREFEVSGYVGRYAMEAYCFNYYEVDHPELADKVRILQNYKLVEDISHANWKRYVISEILADYLTVQPAISIDDPIGPPIEPYLFRKNGPIWTFSFDRETGHAGDLIGMAYIAELLRSPGIEIEATTLGRLLLSGGYPAGEAEQGEIARATLSIAGLPMADAKAIKTVKAELAKTQDELVHTSDEDSPGRTELQRKISQLQQYLSEVEGHRGRARLVKGIAQRSQSSVKHAIDRALGHIAAQHPSLVCHEGVHPNWK